jgi:hypothetical protein
MNIHTAIIVTASTCCLLSVNATAEVPYFINFQGTITNAVGEPVNGDLPMQFRFFNAPEGGVEMWSENHPSEAVFDGMFRVTLGNFQPFPDTLFNNPALWLEVIVGTETLVPRTQIASAPFGIKAGSADFAMQAGFSAIAENAGHAEFSEMSVHADFAENAGHANWADTAEWAATGMPDNDWMIDADNVYHLPGNVGIGTTEPSVKLDVVGSRIRLGEPAGTRTKSIELRVDGAAADIQSNGSDLFIKSNSGNTILQGFGGRVGIGTNSPDAILHVAGTSSSWGMFRIARSDSGDHEASMAFIEGADAASNDYWLAGVGLWGQTSDFVIGRAQAKMVITPDPYVGIGVTNPISKLHIKGYEPTYLTVEASTGYAPGLTLNSGGTNQWSILYHPSYSFLSFFREGVGDKMVIKNSGYVGINTTSPTELLHVYSDDNPRILVEAPSSATPEFNLKRGTSTYALYMNSNNDLAFYNAGTHIVFTDDGNVGIGTTSPTERLDVIGTARCAELKITGGSDIAEPFHVDESETVEPGMVMSIDPENPGKLKLSTKSYDHCVAGIVSGAGGIKPGMVMAHTGTAADGEHPIAMTGRVYCQADASNGPIEPGDLLTTSDTPGVAMKVSDYGRANGAIIGKAMTSLDEGSGLILVLVALQ